MVDVAALRASNDAARQETEELRRQVHELEEERNRLQARVSDAELRETGARDRCNLVSCALDVERHRTEEWDHNLEAELLRRTSCLDDAESRVDAAEIVVARLEASQAATGAEMACSARVNTGEADLRRQRMEDLEAKMHQTKEQLRSDAELERIARLQLETARDEIRTMEGSLHLMAANLAASERYNEEAERKTVSVARELLETSQSIAKLRSDVAQPGLQDELEEKRREEGMLEQRLLDLRRGSYGSSAPLPRGEAEMDTAEMELQDLRNSQDTAVNEALRSAWQAERRDYLATEQALEELQPRWSLLHDLLIKLNIAVQHFREELFVAVPSAHFDPLPLLDDGGCEDANLPDAARTLQECVHSLALESRRRVADSWHRMSSGRAPPSRIEMNRVHN